MSAVAGVFGNSQALLRNSQPQKEEVTLKTEEKQRELTCHVVAGGIICWFVTSFAGLGQDHSGCLGKNTNTCRKTAELLPNVDMRRKTHCMKVIWTCLWIFKAEFRILHSRSDAFLQRKRSVIEKQATQSKMCQKPSNSEIAKMPAKK